MRRQFLGKRRACKAEESRYYRPRLEPLEDRRLLSMLYSAYVGSELQREHFSRHVMGDLGGDMIPPIGEGADTLAAPPQESALQPPAYTGPSLPDPLGDNSDNIAMSTTNQEALTSSALMEEYAAVKPFVVNSLEDYRDCVPGDGKAETWIKDQCTLRAAIEEANANPDLNTIHFNIDTAIYGELDEYVIKPTCLLPTITEPVLIDGYMQPGAKHNTKPLFDPQKKGYDNDAVLKIVLDGSLLPAPSHGLFIDAPGCLVTGLVIQNFTPAAVSGGHRGGQGIYLSKDSGGCFVLGNFLGTSVDGMSRAPNGAGVQVGSANNVIGGTAPADHNVISGNEHYGIYLGAKDVFGQFVPNVTDNKILGNYIGTTRKGTAPLWNQTGIAITWGSEKTTIGGPAPGEGNLLSGNTYDGIWISSSAGDSHTIQGNYIGTDKTGMKTKTIPNQEAGILIQNSAHNTVGVKGAGAIGAAGHNVIWGNGWTDGEPTGDGVIISGPDAHSNWVEGNLIGGSGYDGVWIQDAPYNTVAFNVISYNTWEGVAICGPGAVETLVTSNHIGIDASGMNAQGNGVAGVAIFDAPSNEIHSNVISANGNQGVYIQGVTAKENKITGNKIGTNKEGTKGDEPLGNTYDGVYIYNAQKNYVLGNLISGNERHGVRIQGTNAKFNKVDGNYVGLDQKGGKLPNAESGVAIKDGSSNWIGLPASEEGWGNVIIGNEHDGVLIEGGENNFVYNNSISENGSNGVLIKNGVKNHIGRDRYEDENYVWGHNGLGNAGVCISGGHSNWVQGNYIGMADENAEIPNYYGVKIVSSPDNKVGGRQWDLGNVISGNTSAGVTIVEVSASGNRLEGNIIGLAADLTTPAGNKGSGVTVVGAPGNHIGVARPGLGNVIAANEENGVYIAFPEAKDNKVVQNFIGTNKAGTALLGNKKNGVEILEGSFNIIGGDRSYAKNVIVNHNNDDMAGVRITGGPYPPGGGNVVCGNDIGVVNESGTPSMRNYHGVVIDNSPFNFIGGPEGYHNTISGNTYDGVRIVGVGSQFNTVDNNLIGIGSTDKKLPNGRDGVCIENAELNYIGLSSSENGLGNVISANNGTGVTIEGGSNNSVANNRIGTNQAGDSPLPNTIYGVSITNSWCNTIGGKTGEGGNVLAANNFAVGVFAGGKNEIQGNFIGTDASGKKAKGPMGEWIGVWISDSESNLIGGTTAEVRNIISGQKGAGVEIVAKDTQAKGNKVQGNWIGVEADGVTPLPNGIGVDLYGADDCIIGGDTPGEGNVIVASKRFGIQMRSVEGQGEGGGPDKCANNKVEGNYIGTNHDGKPNLGNVLGGIWLCGASNTTIGGGTSLARNVISGNTGPGVKMENCSGDDVHGNYIGLATTPDGVTPLPNTGHGVQVIGSSQIAIGELASGGSPSQRNTIAYNGGDGVRVQSSDGVTIISNIFDNTELGIDLGPDGPTFGEDWQNYPYLHKAITSPAATDTTVKFSLKSPGLENYRFDFYKNDSPDLSTYGKFGEGQELIYSVEFLTKGTLDEYTVYLPKLPKGTWISATATRAATGETSEFSPCIPVVEDSDNDGVPDDVEDAGPNGGDADGNGTKDSRQGNVATVKIENGQYVVITSPANTQLSQVKSVPNPSPYNAPPGVQFPFGFFDFKVTNVDPGAGVVVSIHTPSGSTPSSHWNYGPTPTNESAHWYEFSYDAATGTGAKIFPNRIDLHFVDGQRGDHDLDATNGIIWDPGAPSVPILPGLRLTCDDAPDPARVLTPLTYSLTVTNNAAEDATDVTLTDTLPGGVRFVSASGSHTRSAGVVTWDLGTLAAGESATVTLEVLPTIPDTTITNTATVTGNVTEEDWWDNTATRITTVNPAAQRIVVNTTDDLDDGVCDAAHTSLREAIWYSNTVPGMQMIGFDIPGPGPHTIQPTSALPTIIDPVVIDGTTEPDYAGTPVIQLDGSLAGAGANGLHITAGNSTVRGLAINRFRVYRPPTGYEKAPEVDLNGPEPGFDFITTFTEGAGPVRIADHDAEVRDEDSTTLIWLTATIANLEDGPAEVLDADVSGTVITRSYDSATGVLSLTGSDTLANYQQVLRTMTYENTSQSPGPMARIIRFVANDGLMYGDGYTTTVSMIVDDLVPELDLNGAEVGIDFSTTFTEDGGPVRIADNDAEIRDEDSATLASLTVTITNPWDGAAELLDADVADTSITKSSGAGVLTLTGLDTLENYQQVLRTVTYENTSQNPDTTARIITFVVNDGTTDSATATCTVSMIAEDDPPTVDLNGAEAGIDFSTTFTEDGGPVRIADNDAELRDEGSVTLASLTVTITNPEDADAELLDADVSGTSITEWFDGGTGVLSLTGAATLAQYQQVLRTVTYENTSPRPNTTARIITFVANDGTSDSAAATATVGILRPLHVTIDYRYDANGFFDTQAKRDLMQLAADTIVDQLGDDLEAIVPGGGNTWTAIFEDPSTGGLESIVDLEIAHNEILVFVGGRNLGAVGQAIRELGQGGPGGWTAEGTPEFVTTMATRGEAGADDPSPTDFGPWGGTITFNTHPVVQFHFGETTDGLDPDETDFFSVALHEMCHVLGFGTAESWDTFVDSVNTTFTGPASVAEYDLGGDVPLEVDLSHWSDETTDEGQPTVMDPATEHGARKPMTRLDFAALNDVGWDLRSNGSTGAFSLATLSVTDAAEHLGSEGSAGLVSAEQLGGSSEAGFGGHGILLETEGGNVIEGCYLGTDVTGTTAAGNEGAGIVAVNSSENTIGGLTDAARNLISGNQRAGILLRPGSDSNLVAGNYIGITASGDRMLGNAGAGVEIVGARLNTIGGTALGARNVISGNWSGVRLQGSHDNLVQGNFIGTTPAGGGGVGNEGDGVAIVGGARNTIGGAAPGAGNVISGNYTGIDVRRSAGEAQPELFHRILGNRIGTGPDGQTPVWNVLDGIWIPDGGAVVGGTLPGEGNTIAFNGGMSGDGIRSISDELVIRGNSIFSNNGLGINLGYPQNPPTEVTANDPDDRKPPLNFPVLTDAFSNGVTTRVQGEINTPFYELPSGGGPPVAVDVTLDFYSNLTGYREGPTYLGSVTLEARTGPGGAPTLATTMPFSATLPVGVPLGLFVTATTIKGHRSSEFAAPVQVRGDADGDGVADTVEDAAPGSGDANGDGTPDRLQGNVVSLPNAVDGEYVVLEASGNSLLRHVRALPNPSPGDAPSAATFPLGFFAFTHVVDSATGAGVVSLTDTRGVDMSALEVYGFGPTPDDWTDHWYQFSFDGTTGGESLPDRVDLHLVDNDRGDHDLTADLQVVTLLGAAVMGIGEGTTFVVNTASDLDDGELMELSLREAIVQANFHPGKDRVEFNIPGSFAREIRVTSPLPTITDPIVIDGYTQPGAAPATDTSEPELLIVLDGRGLDPSTRYDQTGLHITGGDSEVRGLVIHSFVQNDWGEGGNKIILENLGGNVIEGNFIGVEWGGRTSFPNTNGVRIDGSPNNRIGGTTPAARNVISGNLGTWFDNGNGVEIRGESATGNVVQGNYIGVDVTGTAIPWGIFPNRQGNRCGVLIRDGASNTTIGGTTGTTPGGPATGAANVISGGQYGIQGRDVSATLIQGNYIGTDVTGTVALGNSIYGIYVSGAETIVGGTTPAARNIISGNDNGISATSGIGGAVIQGNFIGTDVTGTVALGNTNSGIEGGTLIGGDMPGAGNLISGNGCWGIKIGNGAVVQGNFIGTDVTGTNALPNGTLYSDTPPWLRAGIRAGGPALIGGTTPGAANLISGNAGDGIAIYGWENVVQGNLIGTDIAGTRPLGNGSIGVRVQYPGTLGNTIGGTTANAGNTIAFNGAEGVFVEAQLNIAVLGNSIFDNGAMGIDLGPGLDLIADGVTSNDPGDADTGPNNLQNFPVLTAAYGDADTTIEGTLDSLPEKTYRIEFFSNQTVDPSRHGEGEVFLGSADVTTDASGLANFSVTLPRVVPFGHFITATATDPDGNTSEFSRPAGSATPAHGLDFGDAPEPSYPVLLASGGAHHVIVPGFHLGAAVDADEDGQPADLAVGDDGDGTDDEDGVVFLTSLVPGEPACVEVTASATGFLNAWVDFNGDGLWADFRAGEPFQVETDSYHVQENPSVAMNATGNSVIVWKSYDQGWGLDVRAQMYDADGSPVGEELQVNTYSTGPGQDRGPSVAMDAAGNFVIAWCGYPFLGASGRYVFARRYDASGNLLGDEFQVADGGSKNPSVGMDADGNFIIAWCQQTQPYPDEEYDIFAQRYDANGDPVGTEFQVNTYTDDVQDVPTVAMNAAGSCVIVWGSASSALPGVCAQRYDADGSPLGEEFQVDRYFGRFLAGPASAAIDPAGNFVIAWGVWDGTAPPGDTVVLARRYDASGNSVGDQFQVNTHMEGEQLWACGPSVAMDANGNFLVTWQEFDRYTAWGWDLYAQKYDANGNPVGAEFQVQPEFHVTPETDPYNIDRHENPSVAVDALGDFVIAWQRHYGDDIGIIAKRFTIGGESEQIFTDVLLEPGANTLAFPVPASAVITDQTYARFRFSSTAGLPVVGPAEDGEVEDYAVPSVAPNAPPIAVDDEATTVEELSVTINVTANDTDVDGNLDLNSVTLLSGPANGRATVDRLAQVVTYTPDPEFAGTDSFAYRISDTEGLPDTAVVTVEVLPGNEPPVAEDDTATTDEETPVTIDVVANDTDPEGALDPTTVRIWIGPSDGSVTVDPATGEVTYTPDRDFGGTDSFSYEISDADGASDSAVVTVTVNPVNDPPVANDDEATTIEETPATIDVVANDTDRDDNLDPGSVTVIDGPESGSVAVDPVTGEVTYTPTDEFAGVDTFTYEVFDTEGASDTAAVTIVVLASNNPPSAGDDSATTDEEIPVTIDVVANDSDMEGNLDPGTVKIIAGPVRGSATVDPVSGEITYTPGSDFDRVELFAYEISDTDGASDVAIVMVTVKAINDPPAANDDTAIIDRDAPAALDVAILDVLFNDTDVDGTIDPSTLTIETGPTEGTVVVHDDGTVSYTPAADFLGTDDFTYTVRDNEGAVSNQATVEVTVRELPTTSISGRKFQDLDGDGPEVEGPGLAGFTIHLFDGQGQFVATTQTILDDPKTPEDESGLYRFDGLEPGTYVVGEELMPGCVQTYPADHGIDVGDGSIAPGKHLVSVGVLQPATGMDFGNTLLADFGDAPDTAPGTGTGNYNTLFDDGGPSHVIVEGLLMGVAVDAEVEAIQSPAADGDDADQAPPDDEDGLVDPAVDLLLIEGTAPTVHVMVTNTRDIEATLYGWIDYNGDGVFDNATERASIAVPGGTAGGVVTVNFPVVPTGSAGDTFTRFRLSTDVAAADPIGPATDGEVEDYPATIVVPGSIHGFKYDDVDADGAYDAEVDLPLGGVTFGLAGTDTLGRPVDRTMPTNADGRFRFEGLLPGDYTVTETVPPGHVATTPTSFATELLAGQELVAFAEQAMPTQGQTEVLIGDPLQFGNTVLGSIHGFKFEDMDADGAYDPEIDLPLGGVEFTLTGTDGQGTVVNQTTTTDRSGDFSFPGLLASVAGSGPGTGYTVTETVPPGYIATTPTTFTTDLQSREELVAFAGQAGVQPGGPQIKVLVGAPLKFGNTVPRSCSVCGYIYVDADNDGVKDAGEPGLPNVPVTLSGTVQEMVLTEADGSYRFEQLSPGLYTLIETQPAAFLDGRDTEGTPPPDQVQNDCFVGINLAPGTDAVDYNFGERGLVPELISKRLFLASTPPLEELLLGLTLVDGDVWLGFQATEDTILHAELTGYEGEPPAIELYGDDWMPVAITSGSAQLEAAVSEGESYVLHVSGAGSNADLRLTNTVGQESGREAISGTDQDDLFEFLPGPTPGEWIVRVNGVTHQFTAETITVELDGRGGDDTVLLTGSAGKDTVELWPGRGTLSGEGYTVHVADAESITVQGGGGPDVAVLRDAPDGDDTFKAWPEQAKLYGDGFFNWVKSFPWVHAFSTGGKDMAVLHDDPNGVDTFKFWPEEAKLYGVGFYTRAKAFFQVHAFSSPGNDDVAVLYDNPAGKDTFKFYPGEAKLYGDGFYNRAKAFCWVHAFSTPGNEDVAVLYDHPNGDETFKAWPEQAKLYGDGFFNRAKGFRWVHAFATGGNDVAHLYGSAAEDTLVADVEYTRLYGLGYFNRAVAFDQVHAHAGDDQDVAILYDAVLESGLTQRPVPAEIESILWLYEFERLRQHNDSDDGDSETEAVDQLFTAYWQ